MTAVQCITAPSCRRATLHLTRGAARVATLTKKLGAEGQGGHDDRGPGDQRRYGTFRGDPKVPVVLSVDILAPLLYIRVRVGMLNEVVMRIVNQCAANSDPFAS